MLTVYLFSIEEAWLTSAVGFDAANVVNIRGAQGGHQTVKRHLGNKVQGLKTTEN